MVNVSNKPVTLSLEDLPTLEGIPRFSNIEVITESRITAIFGKKGSGKSAFMAILLEGSRLRYNRDVFYFPEKYAFHEGTPLQASDLVTLSNKFDRAAIGIDEFQQVFSKYRAATYGNRTIGSWLQQVRKRGIELILTSNDPNQIDEALLEQVTLHMWCYMWEDKRCRGHKFHLLDCKDTLYYRIVDTHQKHGKTFFHWDGRKRRTFRVRRMIKYWPLYNTFASVDNLEISALNKEAVEMAYEDSQTDMPYEVFLNILAENIIPVLVERGTSILYPARFSDLLANNTKNVDGKEIPDPIIASAKRVGRALKHLGLLSKRGSAGNAYYLPRKDELEEWQSGLG